MYWTGRKAGAVSNQDDDMLYQPSTKDAPADDANHKHIATYTYDLAKLIAAQKGYKSGDPLTLTVGGGANGSKTADGKTVTLKADKGTGFYAFVFRYAGCDRVTGVTSAYNDPFERVFVQDSKQVTLTSHANPNRVKVGDRFHDTAKISGRYPAKYLDGAYVEFTAYEPVSGEPDMTAAKLLDAEKHPLTADQIDKLANGTEFEVSSSDVAADKAGTVNWQATLFTKDGIRLAGHEFGATDESVEVTGNGKVRSVSQKQGAVGGRMWDLIQVSNVTTGSDRGNVPAGSKVVVDVYKHQARMAPTRGSWSNPRPSPSTWPDSATAPTPTGSRPRCPRRTRPPAATTGPSVWSTTTATRSTGPTTATRTSRPMCRSTPPTRRRSGCPTTTRSTPTRRSRRSTS